MADARTLPEPGGMVAVALGVGALAGAGQLGVAYGLGILWFAGEVPDGGRWAAQLTWVAWCAALAALAGAYGGAWMARRRRLTMQLGTRIIVAVAAGVGAAIVIPLAALPAGSVEVAGRQASTSTEAASAALLGMVVGLLAAVTALSVRLAAVSVALLVAVVWLLALISLAPSLPAAESAEVRLAVLDLPATGDNSFVVIASAPLVALLVCGGIAWAARASDLPPLPTALASTAAPGLLALTYVIGSPGTGERTVQTSPYAGALLAVAAGLLVSLFVGIAPLPSGSAGQLDETAPTDPMVPPPVFPPRVEPSEPLEPVALPEPVSPPAPRSEWPPEPVRRPEPLAPVPGPAPEPPKPAKARWRRKKEPKEVAEPPPPEPPKEPEPPEEPEPPKEPKTPREPKPPRESRRSQRRAKAAAEPPPAAPAPAPVSPAPPKPAGPGPEPPPRRMRRGDEDHVDWISSLAATDEDEGEEPTTKRRLRRDRDAPDPAD